jgi:hypothetical protein
MRPFFRQLSAAFSLATVCSVGFSVQSVADVIFDDFGPGDSYINGIGFTVGTS